MKYSVPSTEWICQYIYVNDTSISFTNVEVIESKNNCWLKQPFVLNIDYRTSLPICGLTIFPNLVLFINS